jgi:diguanylate cyclase (GGDEF)-like protein/PAS domain S-box-containing protein
MIFECNSAMYQQSLNILFVEDSEDDVELTLSEIFRAGYEVSAHRVETAVDMQKALDDSEWDLIISDYKMPEFSAERSLQLYNDNKLDTPFIIISGVVEAEDVVYLLKKGAHDFLNKWSLARLIPAIERELREAISRIAQRQAEQKVSILSLAVEQSPVSVVITDADGIIEYVNPKFEYISGYLAEEAIGRQLGFTLLSNASHVTKATHTESRALWTHIREAGRWGGEQCSVHKDGMLYWEYVNISPLKNDNKDIIRFVAVQEDITVRRSYEEQLRNQAYYDELTGLPNRTMIMETINHAIANSNNTSLPLALLCIDLDHFKNVNDTLGHEIGDKLLIQAASRLAGMVSSVQLLGRPGGDEFFILLPEVESNKPIQAMIDSIMNTFVAPFIINEYPHYITASIGAATYPEHSTDPHTLLKHAELAMYQAKKAGRNQCQFFNEAINAKLNERVAVESGLRDVVERNELELLYQPILDCNTNEVTQCEALLRWKTSDGGYIMPDVFIPIAEDSGLIKQLGEWVIQQACKDLKYLHQTVSANMKFAINISPNQLKEANFSQMIAAKLDEHKLSPEMLELEITESVLIHDLGETKANLDALCHRGMHLSIDDFGTGYSSLGYLQKYPFSTLKVDRSFVSQIEANNNNAKLTETIITMAHNLGMKVVAEGVETEDQQQFLKRCKCDFVQGYLFSRPIRFEQLIEKLKSSDNKGTI